VATRLWPDETMCFANPAEARGTTGDYVIFH
jgi:hypothetical protein